MKSQKWYIFWIIFVGIGFISFAFGIWGYRIYLLQNEVDHSWRDLVYVPLQLFVLESGNLTEAIPWQFEIAQFLAPVLPAWALITKLRFFFTGKLN